MNCVQFINILIESMRKDILELQREIQNKDGESTGTTIKAVLVFFNAIKKYGWDNFDHIIICSGLSKEEACSMEIELIEKYQTTNKDYGYNLTSGGDCPILSSEAREKMSQAMKGNTNGLGHPCSEEKKEKIRVAQIGRRFSEEHKAKLSEAAKHRHTPCSEDKKKKLSQNYPHKRKIYCLETNTIYESVHECARQLNLHATSVSRVCKGKLKSTGGYHLEYFDNTLNAERLSTYNVE